MVRRKGRYGPGHPVSLLRKAARLPRLPERVPRAPLRAGRVAPAPLGPIGLEAGLVRVQGCRRCTNSYPLTCACVREVRGREIRQRVHPLHLLHPAHASRPKATRPIPCQPRVPRRVVSLTRIG